MIEMKTFEGRNLKIITEHLVSVNTKIISYSSRRIIKSQYVL